TFSRSALPSWASCSPCHTSKKESHLGSLRCALRLRWGHPPLRAGVALGQKIVMSDTQASRGRSRRGEIFAGVKREVVWKIFCRAQVRSQFVRATKFRLESGRFACTV